MSLAHEYPELHDVVDRLTPDQASAVRAVVLHLVKDEPAVVEPPASSVSAPLRRLSFAGLMRAESDLAARSEGLLREEFARRPAS